MTKPIHHDSDCSICEYADSLVDDTARTTFDASTITPDSGTVSYAYCYRCHAHHFGTPCPAVKPVVKGGNGIVLEPPCNSCGGSHVGFDCPAIRDICPHCGYCDKCGRSSQDRFYPAPPYAPPFEPPRRFWQKPTNGPGCD